MDSPEILSGNSTATVDNNCTINAESNIQENLPNEHEDLTELQEQVIASFQKPNLPNVNVPERIIICLDVCYDNQNSLFRLGDGTTFTPLNMFKRVLDFFLNTKNSMNKKTEYALIILKNTEAIWVQNFTSSLRDFFMAVDYLNPEESTTSSFDFKKIFHILKKVEVPEYKLSESLVPPPYVVRMIVLYGRSNCIPQIPQEDSFLTCLKKEPYFYLDIVLAHEEDCALYKCEEVYDALQDLDDGYSFVFEVSRNATKIHDCIAKLLAHPLQRPLQKNTDYSFGKRYSNQ